MWSSIKIPLNLKLLDAKDLGYEHKVGRDILKLIFLIYGSNKPNIEVIGLLSNQNTLFVKKIFKEPFLTL